jgi:hypothetical protein
MRYILLLTGILIGYVVYPIINQAEKISDDEIKVSQTNYSASINGAQVALMQLSEECFSFACNKAGIDYKTVSASNALARSDVASPSIVANVSERYTDNAKLVLNLPDNFLEKNSLLIDAFYTYKDSPNADENIIKLFVDKLRIINQKNPQNIEIASALVDSLQVVDDKMSAINVLTAAVSFDQFNPYLNYRLGVIFQEGGDEQAAGYYFGVASRGSEEYAKLILKNKDAQ